MQNNPSVFPQGVSHPNQQGSMGIGGEFQRGAIAQWGQPNYHSQLPLDVDGKVEHSMMGPMNQYYGYDSIERTVVNKVVTADTFYLRIAPLLETDRPSKRYHRIQFSKSYLGILPFGGNPNFQTSRQEAHMSKMVQRGGAIHVMVQSLKTEEGRQELEEQMKALVYSALTTIFHQILLAIFAAKNPAGHEFAIEYMGQPRDVREALYRATEQFGLLNKDPSKLKNVLSRLDAYGADHGHDYSMLVLPPLGKSFLTESRDGDVEYATSGSIAVRNIRYGPNGFTSYRGKEVEEINTFSSEEFGLDANPCTREREYGSFFWLKNFSGDAAGEDFNPNDHCATMIFDASQDALVKISAIEMLDHCGRFSPASGELNDAEHRSFIDRLPSIKNEMGLDDDTTEVDDLFVYRDANGNREVAKVFGEQSLHHVSHNSLQILASQIARQLRKSLPATAAIDDVVDSLKSYFPHTHPTIKLDVAKLFSMNAYHVLVDKDAERQTLINDIDKLLGTPLSGLDDLTKAQLTELKNDINAVVPADRAAKIAEWQQRVDEQKKKTSKSKAKAGAPAAPVAGASQPQLWSQVVMNNARKMVDAANVNDNNKRPRVQGEENEEGVEDAFDDAFPKRRMVSLASARVYEQSRTASRSGGRSERTLFWTNLEKRAEQILAMSTTGGDPTWEQIIMTQWCFAAIHRDNYRALWNKKVDPLCAFILDRPRQQYTTDSGFVVQPGREFAETRHMRGQFMWDQSAIQSMVVGVYNMMLACDVKQPEKRIILDDLLVRSYLGGEDLTFVKREGDIEGRNRANDLAKRPSIICRMVPYDMDGNGRPGAVHDIGGVWNKAVTAQLGSNQIAVDREVTVPSAYFYNFKYGLHKLNRGYMGGADHTFNPMFRTINTVCWQGHQRLFNHQTKLFSTFIQSHDAFGESVYDGVLKHRCSDYSRTGAIIRPLKERLPNAFQL